MKVTNEELKIAIAESHSMGEVVNKLGITRAAIKQRIDRLDIDTSHFTTKPRTSRKDVQPEIIELRKQGWDIKDIAKKFDISLTYVYETIRPAEGYKCERLTKEKIDKIVKGYVEEGKSATVLAFEFNSSHHTIIRNLKKRGISLRKNRMGNFSDEEKQEIYNLYEQNVPYDVIRQKFQTSTPVIQRILKEDFNLDLNREKSIGPRNHQWKGGRRIDANGYIDVWADPKHPFYESMSAGPKSGKGSRYFREHRLVMAEFLGRPLANNETVHHIDGNRSNNDITNLQLRNGNHGPGITFRCRCCGSSDIEAIEI